MLKIKDYLLESCLNLLEHIVRHMWVESQTSKSATTFVFEDKIKNRKLLYQIAMQHNMNREKSFCFDSFKVKTRTTLERLF